MYILIFLTTSKKKKQTNYFTNYTHSILLYKSVEIHLIRRKKFILFLLIFTY